MEGEVGFPSAQIAVWILIIPSHNRASTSSSPLPQVASFTDQVFRALLFSKSNGVQYEDFTLIYSTVIVRFVTLLMDSALHNSGNPHISALKAAEEMQVPSWIVHMRHNVCHRQMPPLKELDKAVDFIHQWLWVGYQCTQARRESKLSGHRIV